MKYYSRVKAWNQKTMVIYEDDTLEAWIQTICSVIELRKKGMRHVLTGIEQTETETTATLDVVISKRE